MFLCFVMEKSYITPKTLVAFIMFYFSSFVACSLRALANPSRTKIVLPIIHRDSVFSPFYNSKLQNSHSSLPPDDDIRGNLVHDANSYTLMVNVSIGDPPAIQLLVMDTGSPLTWVCTKCSPGLGPVYDPKHSSTYNKVSCQSWYQCQDFDENTTCGQDSQCTYYVEYGDNSTSQGDLATEKLTFETSTEGLVELSNIVIGCGREMHLNTARISGILGLGHYSKRSLVARVGKQFSYCIGNISDRYYAYNQLILGDGAIFEGSSTPMVIRYLSSHYYVTLEGVSVGEKQLDIDFKELDFHVLIDSGTTLTFLERNLFYPLQEEVRNLMDGLLQPVKRKDTGERLCFRGNIMRDLKGFPIVSLHFRDGADLELSAEAIFGRYSDNVFCMMIDVSIHDFSIIGLYAQQYYNIGFNLSDREVTFQRIDCELLET